MALDSDLNKVPDDFTPVMNADGQRIRIWKTATTAQDVPLTLHCDNAQPGNRQAVYAVGSPLELSAWDPAHAIPLQPSTPNRWSGIVTLPAQQAIEWKCVIRSLDNINQVDWQADPNNRASPGTQTESVGHF